VLVQRGSPAICGGVVCGHGDGRLDTPAREIERAGRMLLSHGMLRAMANFAGTVSTVLAVLSMNDRFSLCSVPALSPLANVFVTFISEFLPRSVWFYVAILQCCLTTASRTLPALWATLVGPTHAVSVKGTSTSRDSVRQKKISA